MKMKKVGVTLKVTYAINILFIEDQAAIPQLKSFK